MSTTHSQTKHEQTDETAIKHDNIWAVDMGDGTIGFRLADTTPPQAYDKLAVQFSDKIAELKSQLTYNAEIIIGTATLKRDATGCIEITSIESDLENHTVRWS